MGEPGNGTATKKQYLFMTVHEAWGVPQDAEPVWDDSFKEGYVRVEIRGPAGKTQRSTTFTQKVENYSMSWRQDLRLELTDAARELRIMLCRERPRDPAVKKNTSVVAACGIFVKDILDAVPVDKAFELFKPGENEPSIGGFIRVTLRTGPNVPSVPTISEVADQRAPDEEVTTAEPEEELPAGKRGGLFRILLLAGLAASIAFLRIKTHKKRERVESS